jgi:hypothetical protein
MIKKHSFTWRKSIVFSATFLFIALVSVSCKKKENQLGINNIDQNNILDSKGLDTFKLITYTFEQDSVITKNNLVTLLGSYQDPTFGTVNGEIFTQMELESLSPSFGDLSTVVIDSFVLGLVYSGHYGKVGNQTVEVFKIDDVNGIHADSNYYEHSSVSSNQVTSLIATGQEIVNMNPDNITIIDDIEVPSQLRIQLDTNEARAIMQDSQSLPASFESTDAFSDYFKGLHIRTANVGQTSGEGGVMYFDMINPSSKMTIYYKLAGEQKKFDFFINSGATFFNKVDMDNSMTNVEAVINNTLLGKEAFYAQAFKSRAVVEMPSISNIKPNATIHSAIMTLPVAHQTGVEYEPAGFIRIRREDPDNQGAYLDISRPGTASVAQYSSVRKSYTFDLRYHAQRILLGEIENTPLVISPVFFNSSADRIIFNGSETVNKEAPSLRILFTEF